MTAKLAELHVKQDHEAVEIALDASVMFSLTVADLVDLVDLVTGAGFRSWTFVDPNGLSYRPSL